MDPLKKIISQSIGTQLENSNGVRLGKFVDLVDSNSTHDTKYIILQNDYFYGHKNRYYAIPISSDFIAVDENEIIIKAEVSDFVSAETMRQKKLPLPVSNSSHSIFELHRYKENISQEFQEKS